MLGRWLGSDAISKDMGLLLLRLGIGLSMLTFHGYDKITGGTEMWRNVGGSMSTFGLDFAPVMWGFLAAFSEFFASILLILGTFFRPAASMLAFTMLVGVTVHLGMPDDNPASGWVGASHALELMFVYLALILTGPGRYAFRVIRSAKQ